MSVVCLSSYRSLKLIQEPSQGAQIRSPEADRLALRSPYDHVRESLKARFGDELPKHFSQAMSKPQSQPYRYGDVHNVSYRTKIRNWNKPYPVPCEVTGKSCAKDINGVLLLGSKCLEGIDEPLAWLDMKYQVTLNFLKSLPDHTRIKISTRSDLVAHDDYIQELQRLDVTVTILKPIGAPLDMDYDDWTRRIEPGAPSVKRREQALDKLRKSGITAWVQQHEVKS